MVEAASVELAGVGGNDKVFRDRAKTVLQAYLLAAATMPAGGAPLMTGHIRSSDIDLQISALTEIVGALATTVAQLSDRIEHLEADRSRDQSGTGDSDEPADWVWFTPPAAADDPIPPRTRNFVA